MSMNTICMGYKTGFSTEALQAAEGAEGDPAASSQYGRAPSAFWVEAEGLESGFIL